MDAREIATGASAASRESAQNDLLRFVTCGSVDDGKSTLIGRLLHDSHLLMDDQLAALSRDSARYGTAGKETDFALLLDGLQAEREQGITIDVAYRYFTTSRRSFVSIDSPGHEQYTRNMATAASNADVAVILVDARKGVQLQTRRHTFICALLGLRNVVLAVNKIDLVDFRQADFDRNVGEYLSFARGLSFDKIVPIPISARFGDNVVASSANTPWYAGPCLLQCLEAMPVSKDAAELPFRFPVQWVNRPNGEFRGYAGTIVSGRISAGDAIVVAGSGRATRVREIITYDGELKRAEAGAAVTLTLEDELDVARGDLLAPADQLPSVADQFAACLIWMDQKPLIPGRAYHLKIGTGTVSATVTTLKYRIDVTTREHLSASTLDLNEIGVCNLSTSIPVAFDGFAENPRTGCFILIDRTTNRTVGAGMIDFALRRANNISWQPLSIAKSDRAALKRQKPVIVWLTGMSGAGKSTIANELEKQLASAGYHTMILDGDNVRHGLNRDLGFTEPDRVENIRRAGEVAKLMTEGGLIVICSFISPYRAEREMVRGLVPAGEFIEVFVDTPLAEAERRDTKGLYGKARRGELKNFTGIDSPYEPPESPEIHLRTTDVSAAQAAEQIVEHLERNGVLKRPSK
jgi:bifunctional enzyme CysN/CysC